MLFNSLDFLIFFPVVTVLYFAIPKRFHGLRTVWLLLSSYYFYMCWNPTYALLILLSTGITYLSGVLIRRADRLTDPGRRQKRKRLWVVFPLAPIC